MVVAVERGVEPDLSELRSCVKLSIWVYSRALVRVGSSLYRVTMMHENGTQPDLPEGAAADVMPNCYQLRSYHRIADGGQSTKTPIYPQMHTTT